MVPTEPSISWTVELYLAKKIQYGHQISLPVILAKQHAFKQGWEYLSFNVNKNWADLLRMLHLLLCWLLEKLVKPGKVDVITVKVHGLVTKRQTIPQLNKMQIYWTISASFSICFVDLNHWMQSLREKPFSLSRIPWGLSNTPKMWLLMCYVCVIKCEQNPN